MTKKRHWYSRRTWKDAPSEMGDSAMTGAAAWAHGWNDCVGTYMAEVKVAMEAEGFTGGRE